MEDHAETVVADPGFRFDNSYVRDLPGFFLGVSPAPAPAPQLVLLNRGLAEELGLDADHLDGPAGADIFSGNRLPSGAQPVAQAYAGHQFGGFSPQLGDGRALLLGEVIDRHGQRRDIAFKGSGPTPFSRRGDGKAALGPVLREYLIGEAMQAMGIPTTRALAVTTTGEDIQRETTLPGAVLTRVAASHIRVGTFQFFAARGETDRLHQLARYTIARHFPALLKDDNPGLALLQAAIDVQAPLIARWMHVGFIHGVMNTDNMTLSGETIDYGPCAFMDAYNPRTVFSSIDQTGRYAYGNQPAIAHWNLGRLAEALLPLIDENEQRAIARATETLATFPSRYQEHWLSGMKLKLGLGVEERDDKSLVDDLLALMADQRADWTLAFRRLSQAARDESTAFRMQFDDPSSPEDWLLRWTARLTLENRSPARIAAAMDAVNPIVTPRNQMVEEALAAAVTRNDLEPIHALLKAIVRPFDEVPGQDAYSLPAPDGFGPYRTFCGT
jgi:uncharacterized protein YdiU (UPF0061 family)